MHTQIPHIAKDAYGYATLYVDGAPYVGLGGELKNSSFSSLAYMEKAVWPNVRPLGLNTIILPIAWENVEPEEGVFTFDLLEGLVTQARREGVRLVLLWFGLWKNGESAYVPGWVKRDTDRFHRARYPGGVASDTVSPFCDEAVAADARAFARLMRHLKAFDGQTHTVIMVQVENEVGMLRAERDFSVEATRAFEQAVPEALATACQVSGTYTEAFGEDAPETLMAYQYASALERIASAGKAEYPLPMYVNAWLAHYPERPGVHPSGGPSWRMMPIWQLGAPSLDALAPDIYISDFAGVCEAYTQHDNPLIIPEARRDPVTASNVFYAIGAHQAILFAPFGIEEMYTATVPDQAALDALNIASSAMVPSGTAPYLARSYQVLEGAMPLLLARRDALRPFMKLNEHDRGTILPMALCDLQIAYEESQAGKPGTAGIVLEMTPGDFLFIGCRFSVRALPKINSGQQVTTVRVEEGELVAGAWQPGRILNGDERNLQRIGDMAGAMRVCVCVSDLL